VILEPPDITHPPLKIKMRGAGGIDCLNCAASALLQVVKAAWIVIAFLKSNILFYFFFYPFNILNGVFKFKINF